MTADELRQIVQDVVRAELVDIRQAHGMRLQVIDDLAEKLSDCRDTLTAIVADRDGAAHSAIDARAASETWRAVATRREARVKKLEQQLMERLLEIGALKRRISELENDGS